MKQGFTLVELLVVVLIIGILAAIALPQYESAVEKARLTEALVNMKAIGDAAQRYDQANPGESINTFSQIADVDLKGGSISENHIFTTKLFKYTLVGGPVKETGGGRVLAVRMDGNVNLYEIVLNFNGTDADCAASFPEYEPLCTFFMGNFNR